MWRISIMIAEIIVGLGTGFISGIVSGILVTIFFEKRSHKKHVEEFWSNYLWKSLEYCHINIPIELLGMLKPLGGQNSRFGKAIMDIQDVVSPLEEEEMSEEQVRLFNDFKVAYEEYAKWVSNSKKKLW